MGLRMNYPPVSARFGNVDAFIILTGEPFGDYGVVIGERKAGEEEEGYDGEKKLHVF